MYLSILDDQSWISNWYWVSLHVYIAIFSFLIHHYCVCVCFVVFGSAPTILVQVDWASGIALGVPTLCVKSQYTHIAKRVVWHNGTWTVWFSVQWYANRLVLGTMVRESLCFGLICPFFLDLPLLDVSCLSLLYLSLLGLSLHYCFCMFCMFCMFCIVLLGG